MATLHWHAYYYEGPEIGGPPVLSTWIEAASEDEAINIARKHDGRWRSVELVRPRWAEAAQTERVRYVAPLEDWRQRIH